MAILDADGRLFGKLNIIDAAIGLFFIILIPLAFSTWAMFRTKPPVIMRIEPPDVRANQPNQSVVIVGQNFRPFLRPLIGKEVGVFLFETPERGEVKMPPMPPGVYDLRLYDVVTEVSVLPNSVTYRTASDQQVQVIRVAGSAPRDHQRFEVDGANLRKSLTVLIGDHPAAFETDQPGAGAFDLPALEPGIYDVALFEGPAKDRKEVARLPKAVTIATIELVLRAPIKSDAVEALKAAQSADRGRRWTTQQSVLASYQLSEPIVGSTKIDLLQGPVSVVRAVLRMAAVKVDGVWQFDGHPVRVGQGFKLAHPMVLLDGEIIRLTEVPGRAN
jgi:hypothetical protein